MSALLGWPRLPPCCSSAGPSTPRSGPPARPWKPRSSTPMCSSSGPSRSGCSTPPPASCAGAVTRRTRPSRAPPGAWSRWPSPRSSSSARARSRGSGSPGRRGRWCLQRGDGRRAAAGGLGARLADQARFRALVPRWRYAFEILRVSVPSAASTLLTNLTFIILTALVAPFGTEATAGYGAAGRLEYLLIPIVFGVGSALVPLVAASDGAGDFGRVRSADPGRRGAGAGAAGWWASPPRCSRGRGWGCSPRTPRWRGSAGRTWPGSARPTPSSGWGWPCTSPPRAGADGAAALATLTRLLVAGVLGALGLRSRLGDRLPVRPDGLRPRATGWSWSL